MKAITVRQPWASLFAAGVKTIETRPRRTGYRGRIAIHAAKVEWWPQGYTAGDWRCFRSGGGRSPRGVLPARAYNRSDVADKRMDLPLGVVVASAVLTDCVSIVDAEDSASGNREVAVSTDGRYLWRRNGRLSLNIDDQLPFGDFSPGRWALLLDDIAPTTDRCPWCWGAGLTGEQAWEQVSREGGIWLDIVCPVCDGLNVCGPVPARGQQAVPWEWTPSSIPIDP